MNTEDLKTQKARQLSHELREVRDDADLTRRRWMVGLQLVSLAAGKAVAAYQMGLIKKLPDPPIPLFDSTKVDASPYAYKRASTPDAFGMLISTATTAWLASVGGKNRAEETPAVPLLLATKAFSDVAVTLELTREEWNDNKALCFYCQVATLCAVGTAALSVPEAIRAVKAISSQGKQDKFREQAQFGNNASPSGYADDADLPRSGTFIAEDRLEAHPEYIGETDSLSFNGVSPTSGGLPSNVSHNFGTTQNSPQNGMSVVNNPGALNAVDEDGITTDSDTFSPAPTFAGSR
jgi:hypothetical protein